MAERAMINKTVTVPGIFHHSRVFALEFQQSDIVIRTHTGRQADLIAPSGERISRCYTCGTLTEINRGGKGGGYIRVADPTGVLVLHIRAYSPDILAVLDNLTIPAFVSVIASVETDNHPGESGFRLILEMISPSDRSARDRWIVRTSGLTLNRLQRLSRVLSGEQESDSEEVRKAIARYKTSNRQLHVLAGMVEKALGQVQVISPESEDETTTKDQDHGSDAAEKVLDLIRQHSGPRGISVQELVITAGKAGVSEPVLMDTIRGLIAEDELYQPSSGFIKIL